MASYLFGEGLISAQSIGLPRAIIDEINRESSAQTIGKYVYSNGVYVWFDEAGAVEFIGMTKLVNSAVGASLIFRGRDLFAYKTSALKKAICAQFHGDIQSCFAGGYLVMRGDVIVTIWSEFIDGLFGLKPEKHCELVGFANETHVKRMT